MEATAVIGIDLAKLVFWVDALGQVVLHERLAVASCHMAGPTISEQGILASGSWITAHARRVFEAVARDAWKSQQ